MCRTPYEDRARKTPSMRVRRPTPTHPRTTHQASAAAASVQSVAPPARGRRGHDSIGCSVFHRHVSPGSSKSVGFVNGTRKPFNKTRRLLRLSLEIGASSRPRILVGRDAAQLHAAPRALGRLSICCGWGWALGPSYILPAVVWSYVDWAGPLALPTSYRPSFGLLISLRMHTNLETSVLRSHPLPQT